MSECKHVGWQHTADGGGWCAWCEIESLRDEVKLAKYQQSQAEASCHILQAEIDAMKDTDIEDDLAERDKRIEELEIALFRWEQGGKDDGIFFITNEQIDMLWKRRSFYTGAVLTVIDDCLDAINIVACGECGGRGVRSGGQSQFANHTTCHQCKGRGWIRKERGDE